MKCKWMDASTNQQCEEDATRRAIVAWENPPAPGQQGSAGTIYMVETCDEHDPDPTRSLRLP